MPASIDSWTTRVRRAGFARVETEDWTDTVSRPGLGIALDRARRPDCPLRPLIARYTALQLAPALRSVERGELGYYAVLAER